MSRVKPSCAAILLRTVLRGLDSSSEAPPRHPLPSQCGRVLWTKIAHGVEPIRIASGARLVGACIEGDQSILINNAKSDPRQLRRIDDKSGYHTRHVLCVPLCAHGSVIGALQLLNKPHGLTEVDISLLGLLAHFSPSAIETERLRGESESARLILQTHAVFDTQAAMWLDMKSVW